jgi:hypothetical protein
MLDLPTLQHRRRRGDLIWTYKILTNNESDELLPTPTSSKTNLMHISDDEADAINLRMNWSNNLSKKLRNSYNAMKRLLREINI